MITRGLGTGPLVTRGLGAPGLPEVEEYEVVSSGRWRGRPIRREELFPQRVPDMADYVNFIIIDDDL